MRNTSLKRLALVILCALLVVPIAHQVWQWVGSPRPHRLAGTDAIEPSSYSPWFSISPSERWIAFMEVDSVFQDPERFAQPRREFHLVTMDLRTGAKTHHNLDSIPESSFQIGNRDSNWEKWSAVQMGFEAACWLDSNVVVGLRGGPSTHWIAFTPGTPSARVAVPPNGDLLCVDCAPPSVEKEARESRGLFSSSEQGISIAFKDGRLSDVAYEYPAGRMGIAVERVNRDGSRDKLVRMLQRWPADTHVGGLRVSPDERFLAYTFSIHLELSPFGHDELNVFDLETGKARHVFGSVFKQSPIESLMWSADSKRLYFASGYVDPRGVYRLTLPD